MKPKWGGNRGRGRGSRGRGRGWRGNSSGPRGGGPSPAQLSLPMEYHGPRIRGHRGGYRGRPPPDNFNQSFSPHSNEPPWACLRACPYSSGVVYNYPAGLHQRRPFLSPPRPQQSPDRPSSPLPGSEEYMQRDISEKSAFLKRQLELEEPPPVPPTAFSLENKLSECDFASDSATENFCDNPFIHNSNLVRPTNDVQNKCDDQTPSPRRNKRLTRRQKKPQDVLSVEEIHDKIINHISNLSHGKKVNLVNQAGPSGYDIAVQQITRQKRLELSKALRDMCKNKFRETDSSSQVINAIIPDFDIKIEQLPREVVEQLSSTLNEDVEEHIQTMCIDPEVMFQQAADMLNIMLDVENEVKSDVNLADCDTPLQDEFNSYPNFQNAVESGDISQDGNVSQNIGDPCADFVPNDTHIQPRCTNFPFDETIASAALSFHNDSIPCQSSSVNFSVPLPINFTMPPPLNFGLPPPSMCEHPNNESLACRDFSNSQHNNLNIPDDSYNTTRVQSDEACVYPETNPHDTQYYSPEHPCSDENSLQATPVFNDLMVGQDLLNDNNIEQTDLSLPLKVDDGGLLLPSNPCDNSSFNLVEDQESEQYFKFNPEDDRSILMPPNEQPYNMIARQDQLPENLKEQNKPFLPSGNEINNIILSSQSVPVKNVIHEAKAIILSDIRIPPVKVTSQYTSKVSDVLTEAAELEACLAQTESDLKRLNTSKSNKISFTFNKTNSFIKSKALVDDTDDVTEDGNSSKKLQSNASKRKSPTEAVEASTVDSTVKIKFSEDALKCEPVFKVENIQNSYMKVDLGKIIKSNELDPEQNKLADKTVVSVQEVPESGKTKYKNHAECIQNEATTRVESISLQTEKAALDIPTNMSENIKDTENPEKLLPIESPIINNEIEQRDKHREKSNEKPSKYSKKMKSRSKSSERQSPQRGKSEKSVSRKSKMKQKSFEEEEVKKEKKSKSKSNDIEEYSKADSYKSKFERSRYDIFYSQKYDDEYKKKHKEKGRELIDEDRHRRSDSDRSFEKYREKFRSSDSEHSEHRYSKYHQERDDVRHSKRYYHECYPPYRTDYADYKNEYYNSQKYGYTPEYYSKQESPYSPEDFEAKSSHHTQKHKTKYEKTRKKRSKKHKRQREKSSTSLSSISSEERDSSESSLNRKTKHKSKHQEPLDTDERSTSKSHKIPLKDRIQMLHEFKFDKKRENSSDYDENRKIKSEPASPEVSRQPSPERSRSVEKLQGRGEPIINADDLREALNKKALSKSASVTDEVNINSNLLTKTSHPGTPVVPFTNEPCPARKQVEDPQREREEMIMKRDSLISFRNKQCPLGKKPVVEEELEPQQEGELQLTKELPDIDNIAKIISNLSTIVTPTKETASGKESQNSNKHSVKIVDDNEKPDGTVGCKTPPQQSEPKKFVQRPWKSPGEKKFMMEHLQQKQPYEEELYYEPNKNASLKDDKHVSFSEQRSNANSIQKNITDKFVVQDNAYQEEKLAYVNPEPITEKILRSSQEEKLAYLNPEPSIQNSSLQGESLKGANIKSVNSASSTLKILNVEENQNQLKIENIRNQDFLGNLNMPNQPKAEKSVLNPHEAAVKKTGLSEEVDRHHAKPQSTSKIRELDEINSTSEKANTPVSKTLKEVESKPLGEPHLASKISELSNESKLPSTNPNPASAESAIESQNKCQDTKDPSRSNNTRRRSKSRSRSKTKELELLHSAEVSSTSDTAARFNSKVAVGSTSRSKSKIRCSTPLPTKEESSKLKIELGNKITGEPLTEALEQAIIEPEDMLGSEAKMLITTYTQTCVDGLDETKDTHRSRKSSNREKSHSSSSHKSKSKRSVSIQTLVSNTNSYTQTSAPRCKNVQVQSEVEEEKVIPKKSIFVQTDPVDIFEDHADGDDLDDKIKQADKSSRRILKAVRRRQAVDRMVNLDKEIERLTKLRQSLYKKLYYDSDSEEDDSFEPKTKVTRMKIYKNPPENLKNDLIASSPHSNKSKPIVIRRKSDVNKKRKKKYDASVVKQNRTNKEDQSQLVGNANNPRTNKKTVDVKKDIQSLTKHVIKNQGETISEGTSRGDDSVLEKVRATSSDKTAVDSMRNANVENSKINKAESKSHSEKFKPEQNHYLNRHITDSNTTKGKLKSYEQKNGNPAPKANIKSQSSDKDSAELDNEKCNSLETLPTVGDTLIDIHGVTSENLDLNKNSSPTNKKAFDKSNRSIIFQHTDLADNPVIVLQDILITSGVEKLRPTEAHRSKKDSNITSCEISEENLKINVETKTPSDQRDKLDSETEDSTRSARSRQKKPKDAQQQSAEETAESKSESRRRHRKKTDGENKPSETSENVQKTSISNDANESKADSRRRHRKKTDSESKPDTSVERDASGAEDATHHRLKKKLSESRSLKHSKDSEGVLKSKVKSTDEQKKWFQANLKESDDVNNPPTKRRRKTTTESSVGEFVGESSKTIDKVARNDNAIRHETDVASFSTQLLKKGKEEAAENKIKLKGLKRVLRNSKEFEEAEMVSATTAKIKESSISQSDLQDDQGCPSDSLVFRGFKKEPYQKLNEINSTAESLHVRSEESTSNKFNGNFNENFTEMEHSQKRKKRKKDDTVELDPAIDSQNLLQVQKVKRPKNTLESCANSTGGMPKKKKKYPFSKVNWNYRTKKRKSSSDTSSKSTSSARRKPISNKTKIKLNDSNLGHSIVRITRYSLLQLEEIRKSIRGQKETVSTHDTVHTTNKEISVAVINEAQQEEQSVEQSECTETIAKAPSDAYNLRIEPVESLDADVPYEGNSPSETVQTMPAIDDCTRVEEEIHLKEEALSVHSVDYAPENNSCNSINSALHLETSNEAFEDFVKESMHEHQDNEDNCEPPILTPEVEDSNDLKIPDCEYLEVVDEDDDYKMDFEGFTGAILVIRVIASTALAASDKGKVFCFNMLDGSLINTFDMSKLAITSMIVIKRNETNLVYTGSLDSCVGVLNFNTKEVLKHEKIPEPVQCMEYAWNFIFIGSDRGSLIRYDLNVDKVEDVMKITEFNVLVIKATQEGPRKVLVVATRNAPVSIRDAMSGLLLRTMQTPFSPTVYTLLFEKNLIYCGTSQHDILVYTFEDGQLIFKHEATKSKGVVCMQIVGNLLFAGCYNGNIYVYNTKTNIHLGTMNGPGGLMLSMEIVHNKIIVGTKSSNFRAWRIPQKYLDQM